MKTDSLKPPEPPDKPSILPEGREGQATTGIKPVCTHQTERKWTAYEGMTAQRPQHTKAHS
jgi:hypothetical protein